MVTKVQEERRGSVPTSVTLRICEELRRILSPERYEHCQGVMNLATQLAQKYGGDPEKAALAGILHDIARELSPDQLLAEARRHRIPVDPLEEKSPILLHGKIGALHARLDWGVDDPEVLEAIALHITADSHMSLTAQLIFLADFAEPGRSFGSARFARELSYINLGSALEYVLNQEIIFVLNQGFLLHPKTLAARNRLLLEGTLNP
jgi:predicted HD superfamily hydrolase involved in NAD metabolism